MSRICGIELKSSAAILVVLETDQAIFVDIELKKISLEDDESGDAIKAFHKAVINFIKENQVDTVVIKKRAKKGRMAGGAISFKMEAIIQLNGVAAVEFVSGQGIAAAHKKSAFEMPKGLKKYQEAAFMAASLYARANS
jgi:hypothetical protein